MKITFCGAARQVTGSMHLLELESGYRILLDCGLDYEEQRNFHYQSQVNFPFDPSSLDLVILSHAHIDHSGNIPSLVKQGYTGTIICTPPTANLCMHLLLDSANIQAHDYKKGKKGKIRTPKPLYTDKHVKEAMKHFRTVDFHQPFRVNEQVLMEFSPAGHLLGAAAVHITASEQGKTKTFAFTGDWGRNQSPLIPDPEAIKPADVLLSESTYGARMHRTNIKPTDELMQYVESCCIQKKGRLIIPAFSVGRTQSIIFTLHQLQKEGRLPNIRIFVDSPLAIKSTNIYSHYPELMNDEARLFMDQYGEPLIFENLRLIEDRDDSMGISTFADACIIVSAAGMVEGGRIQQHIAANISNPYSTILIAGYCSEGTLGHRLLQGLQTVKIKNRDLPVYATVASTDVFSSHADGAQLLDMITAHQHQKLFLVHGDMKNMEALADKIQEKTGRIAECPEFGDEYSW
jgi:metallo-beta-lactamase family protein